MRHDSDLSDTISWNLSKVKSRSFEVGDKVAERYEIVRFIARGSGGEIYEAQDLQLKLRLALKTVIPESADDRRAQGRFRREILLARQVTHPNVCRIFDLGIHRPADGGEEVTFLTMELLEGRTLAERVEQEGRMDPEEALPLVRQMARALAAAHRVGVVHRDFKSSNVVLVDAGGGRLRVVVADFGLARHMAPPDSGTVLTREGTIIGTPAYMAPEQVMGKEVDELADVYALGVVLYELVTARLPFAGGQPIDVATRRLREDAPSPRLWVPDLDPRWERTILRCLERQPADRFRSPLEVVRALEGRRPALSPRRRRSLALAFGGLALLAVLVVAAAIWERPETPVGEEAAIAAPGELPSLALLGFRNLREDPEKSWIGDALYQVFDHELGSRGDLAWRAGEEVRRALGELGVEPRESLAPDTRHALGEGLGVGAFVFGSYLALGGEVSLYVYLQRLEGDPVHLVEKGGEDELTAVVARMVERVSREMGLGDRGAAGAAETQR